MTLPERALDERLARACGWTWIRSTTPPAGYGGWNGESLAPWRWLVSPASMNSAWGARQTLANGTETPFIDNLPRYSSDENAFVSGPLKVIGERGLRTEYARRLCAALWPQGDFSGDFDLPDHNLYDFATAPLSVRALAAAETMEGK